MKKRLFLLFLILQINISLYAATGVLSGEKNLRVAKTQWFDIIYPERCEKSAAILYEKADTIYEEVTNQYGIKPSARIPVVITPAVENLNAFWAVLPYSHIVLYDTSSDKINELSVYSETFLSIFRHELTHAVTYTMKNGFWSSASRIFGDAMNLGQLFVTTGMAEGATLTSESAAGEGRLNDEYSKHSVKQAKIEGKFPKYSGVQGAGNLNPYYFNGAFHEWLQNNYGMDAYAKFWYSTINVQKLTLRGRFKKAFGVPLDKAWKSFIADYKVPAVHSNPVLNHQARDFFESTSVDYSYLNNAGSLYTSLAASDKKIYWLDMADRGIFAAEKTALNHVHREYKKLFTQTGAYSVSPSVDDKFLAVSFYSDDKLAITGKIKIYDSETRQLYTVNEKSLKDGSIVKKDGEYYLVASKFESPFNAICIFKILTGTNGRISGVENVAKLELPLNVFAAEYTALEGQFAFIKKDGLNYSVCVADLEGKITNEYVFPQDRIVIHSLSQEGGTLYFSWAQRGTMPRLGRFNLADGKLALSNTDLSGGVFSPVSADGSIVYIGNFLHQNRLLTLLEDDDWETLVLESENPAEKEPDTSIIFDYEIPPSEKYNYFSYLNKGFIIPVSFYTSEYFGPNSNKTSMLDIPVGVSYFTGFPWSDGMSDSIIFTGGWNLLSRTVGLELITNFGTNTSILNSQADIKTEFDAAGWKLSTAALTLSSSFHFGKTSIFQATNVTKFGAGRQYTWIETEKFPFYGYYNRTDSKVYYDFYDNFMLAYSNVHYAGPGSYEKAGITTSAGIYWLTNSWNIYGGLTGYIPRLLPFESKYGYTLNLPSTIGLRILNPSANYFAIYEVDVESVLFGMLIKQPMPVIDCIYLQNWTIKGGYKGFFEPLAKNIRSGVQVLYLPEYTAQLFNGQFTYIDTVYLQADLKISPNMGILSRNDIQVDFAFNVAYKINNKKNYTPFTYNFAVNLNY